MLIKKSVGSPFGEVLVQAWLSIKKIFGPLFGAPPVQAWLSTKQFLALRSGRHRFRHGCQSNQFLALPWASPPLLLYIDLFIFFVALLFNVFRHRSFLALAGLALGCFGLASGPPLYARENMSASLQCSRYFGCSRYSGCFGCLRYLRYSTCSRCSRYFRYSQYESIYSI